MRRVCITKGKPNCASSSRITTAAIHFPYVRIRAMPLQFLKTADERIGS